MCVVKALFKRLPVPACELTSVNTPLPTSLATFLPYPDIFSHVLFSCSELMGCRSSTILPLESGCGAHSSVARAQAGIAALDWSCARIPFRMTEAIDGINRAVRELQQLLRQASIEFRTAARRLCAQRVKQMEEHVDEVDAEGKMFASVSRLTSCGHSDVELLHTVTPSNVCAHPRSPAMVSMCPESFTTLYPLISSMSRVSHGVDPQRCRLRCVDQWFKRGESVPTTGNLVLVECFDSRNDPVTRLLPGDVNVSVAIDCGRAFVDGDDSPADGAASAWKAPKGSKPSVPRLIDVPITDGVWCVSARSVHGNVFACQMALSDSAVARCALTVTVGAVSLPPLPLHVRTIRQCYCRINVS